MWDSVKCGRKAAYQTVVIAFFFLFGIVIGSFLNVCITRIPEELSIVSPGSRCPRCEKPIKPYDNVPVFAGFGCGENAEIADCRFRRCIRWSSSQRDCLFVGCYLEFGISRATIKWLFFICLIIILTVTDLRVRLLPDLITWPGFAAGVLFSAFVPPPKRWCGFSAVLAAFPLGYRQTALGVIEALLGAAFGSLMLWGAAALYKLVRRREGMGMGDVKMMAMAGAFLGIRNAFLVILLRHIARKHFRNRRDWHNVYAEWESSSRSGPASRGWAR